MIHPHEYLFDSFSRDLLNVKIRVIDNAKEERDTLLLSCGSLSGFVVVRVI